MSCNYKKEQQVKKVSVMKSFLCLAGANTFVSKAYLRSSVFARNQVSSLRKNEQRAHEGNTGKSFNIGLLETKADVEVKIEIRVSVLEAKVAVMK